MINLVGKDGNHIDIFGLYAVLFVGNDTRGEWNLTKTYTKYGEGRVAIALEDFEGCDTKQEVVDRFCEMLIVGIKNKLV